MTDFIIQRASGLTDSSETDQPERRRRREGRFGSVMFARNLIPVINGMISKHITELLIRFLHVRINRKQVLELQLMIINV